MLFWTILLLLLVACAEGAAGAATGLLTRWGWMAYTPAWTGEQVAYFFKNRNPHLGWGPAVDAKGKVLILQPRADPAHPASQMPCASVYGDSFTEGAEVGDGETYPHELGLILGCGVANYGVGGYGSDQALLLARAQSGLDRAQIVILSHVSENILRNVNQFRNLLYPGDEYGFKPRYVLDNGMLRLVRSPVDRVEDFQRMRDDLGAVLRDDAFVARPRRQFPHALALVRWAMHDFHVRAHLARLPRHEPFYRPDHPAGGLALTTSILSGFAAEAKQRGQSPVVVLVPVGRDFRYAQKSGRWPDQPLVDELGRAGVRLVHAGPEMQLRLDGEDPCNLFADCSSHFNPRGYRLLAGVVSKAVAPLLGPGRPGKKKN